MSELRDVLKAHDDALAASVRVSAEFDAVSARSGVRRRRTARAALTATASVAAAGAVVAGGWGVYSSQQDPALPVVSPSATHAPPSEVPSVSPSATASGRDAVAGPCPSRATSMTAEQASIVAGEPLTGEVWLDEPERTTSPDGDETATWYLLGHHGDNQIVGVSGAWDYELFEVSTDGTVTRIARPTPTSTVAAEWLVAPDAPVDDAQCYESLALPSTLTLNDGIVVDTPDPMSAMSQEPQWTGISTVEASWGESSLQRIINEQPQGYDNKDLPEGSAAIDFELRLPFGWYRQVPFNPFDGADAEWGGSTTDYYDSSCGAWTGPAMRASGTSESDWTVIDSFRGRDVAVATASNPYAIERYAAYVKHFELIGDTETVPVDFATFLATPGVVGLRADEGGWWVQINGDVSPRAWC